MLVDDHCKARTSFEEVRIWEFKSEENQCRLKSMTDLRGMEVRNERTALIKTGDWSPDCEASTAFRMMGISTNRDRSSLNGRSWQNALIFTVIASYFITSACLLYFTPSLHFSIKGVIADEKFWRGCIYGVINGGRSNK